MVWEDFKGYSPGLFPEFFRIPGIQDKVCVLFPYSKVKQKEGSHLEKPPSHCSHKGKQSAPIPELNWVQLERQQLLEVEQTEAVGCCSAGSWSPTSGQGMSAVSSICICILHLVGLGGQQDPPINCS